MSHLFLSDFINAELSLLLQKKKQGVMSQISTASSIAEPPEYHFRVELSKIMIIFITLFEEQCNTALLHMNVHSLFSLY